MTLTPLVSSILSGGMKLVASFFKWVASFIFMFNAGKKAERLKNAEERAERLSNRPRTADDVVNSLRDWRVKVPKRK